MRRLLLPLLLLGSAWACVHARRALPGLEPGRLVVDGRERTWLASTLQPGAPLVISLHGRFGDAAAQARRTGMLELARREGFTVVFPDGVRRSWNDARAIGPAAEQGVDDLGFLSALIDHFAARGADPRRVYLLGMSNGGFMALTAACRLSEKVAAVGSVTGTVSRALEADCAMARPVPTVLFLGTEDPLVPFDGGVVARDRGEVLGGVASAGFLAAKNGCAGPPASELLPDLDPADGTRVERWRWEGCPAPVELHVVQGGGHTWPTGQGYDGPPPTGRVTRDVDASEAAWAFFRRFSR